MARHTTGARQRKSWVSMGNNIINVLSSDATGIVAGGVTRDEPFTVLRMIGEWCIGPSQVNVINDTCAVSLAVGVVSTDAYTVGGTAVPDPESEVGFPWLYWQSFVLNMQKAQQDSQGDPFMSIRRTFDIRTMRKIKPRESLVQIFQYRDVSGTPFFDLAWGVTRVLIGH